ncbi:DUF2568 domain-containing protein [Yinghuangia seranimata]|uniref:DUF2568 domain-containing protein n=1 Tax=Yinghuangia seranimata TaxID=408067 RepID=UPI00248C4C82|nr:DUF2568 domain-containing protein [Yinghuangia seranimata]MDI2130626.1 DUF2568 domain-containing protein [Yinghuangia seranimata]
MMIRGISTVGRYVLVAGACGALAWWGVDLGRSWVGSLILAVGFPALAAVTWGNFASPWAPQPLSALGRLALEALLLAVATVGLAAMGQWIVALVFGAASGVVVLAAYREESGVASGSDPGHPVGNGLKG